MATRYTTVVLQPGKNQGNAFNRTEMKKHLEHFCTMIDWAVNMYTLFGTEMGVKLIVGAEFGVFGFPSGNMRELHDKYAIEVPGEEMERITEKCKEYNCYISPGSVIEKAEPEISKYGVFNTYPLIGPEGVLFRYRKVQVWKGQEAILSPHDLMSTGYNIQKNPLFPVVKTEIGNLGAMICFDMWYPEIARQLAANGCEIFLGAMAAMNPFGRPPQDNWLTFGRARAIENMAYGVYAFCGFDTSRLPPFPTSGGSFICDYKGILQTRTEAPTETMTAATIDLDALRAHRKHSRITNTLAMLRSETYDYLKKSYWRQRPELKDLEQYDMNDCTDETCDEIDRFWSEYYGEKSECPRWRPPQWKTC